jgi:hypothetical protein
LKLGVNRNGKQCRERWYNFLNPEINRDPFTAEEDLQILQLRQKIGNRWSEIIKHLPGRTENSVKNRFNCMFKKIREENLTIIKDSTMQAALEKIKGTASDSIVDEDKLLQNLIDLKREQIKNSQNNTSRKANFNSSL